MTRLKEAFPGVKIRSEVKELGNLKPDAHLRTPDGKILIVDSKFVFDTYSRRRKMQDTPVSQVETVRRKATGANIQKDVVKHVEKIRLDYIQPMKGHS